MFMHNKRLMYTVRVSEPNPVLASLFLEQFGGPQGELAAAMRYFTQAVGETDAGRKDMLLHIATEELSHLEVIGSMIVMLTKGVKGKLAEGKGDGELLSTRWRPRRSSCPTRRPSPRSSRSRARRRSRARTRASA